MSFHEELAMLKAKISSQLPEETSRKFEQSIKDLSDAGVAANAPRVGDRLNSFDLSNQSGIRRSLDELLTNGPAVIVFYRGSWCPYCNLELRSYQKVLPEIKAAGAQLVAITPELPDSSLTIVEKNELDYEVLSDVDSIYTKEIGLSFTLDNDLRKAYADAGADLADFNGEGQYSLPVPATYVVSARGSIVFAHVDVDYTTRANPEEVLKIVKAIS